MTIFGTPIRWRNEMGGTHGTPRNPGSARGALFDLAVSKLVLALMMTTALVLVGAPAGATDFTARELTKLLYGAAKGSKPDLNGKDLSGLDLAGVDFKGASLAHAHLFGADLSGANLANATMAGANLDRATIIGTNFEGADLEGASLLRPTAFRDITAPAADAPIFRNANLRHARIFARLSRADFSGADLSDTYCAPFGKTGFIEVIWRTELNGARLADATLARADLTHATFNFADLTGADLSGAILVNADLSGADLTGANLAGADLSGADLDGTILRGARGLETALGLASARNAERAVR